VHDLPMLTRHFQLEKLETTVTRELFAGLTTFLTMAYILVVQPAILSQDFNGQPTGLEPGAVFLATCLASAFATLVMALYANLPVALAPGMGQNVFFVSVVVGLGATTTSGAAWQSALGLVLVSGVLFLFVTLVGLRSAILTVMSPGMRSAVSVGIGLFIALIGLRNGGVVTSAPTLVTLNAAELLSADSAVFWIGLGTTLVLTVAKIPGAILLGIAVSGITAWATGMVTLDRVFGFPEFEHTAILELDLSQVLTSAGLTYVAVFLFMDVFDTTGTLVGVAEQAGLTQDGEIKNVRQAMLADAAGTVAGACLGTSTITSFIESAAGVQQGGRSGLTAATVAVLFLAALAFSPLVMAIGSYPPITAPALVVVGSMMFRNVVTIVWTDETEGIPAFLTIIGIPLFFSIADGIAVGLILWPILKVAAGRWREVSWNAGVLAVILVLYFLFVRTQV